MKAVKREYFKKEKHIEPILIYTSDLSYKDKKGQSGIIYKEVNLHLRNCNLLTTSENEFKSEWKNRFSSDLLKHLHQIERTSAKVFRGVDYDLCCEQGDNYTFVPFTSTSRKQDVAIKFSTQSYPDPSKATSLSLLILNVKTSKPIE
jgi:hypothetical protein